MKETRRFFGGMDLDNDADHIQEGDYREAFNCIDHRGNSSRGLLFNLQGTVKKDYTFTGAGGEVWTVIGSCEDLLTHKLYYFVYGSETNHHIIEFDLTEPAATIGYNHSAVVYKNALLGFSLSYPIQALVRDGVLIWTDNNIPPRHLNIAMAKNFTVGTGTPIYAAIDAQVLDCVWYPPAYAPVVAYGNEGTRKINNLIKKNFQFAYRYIYYDHGKSVLGPYSYIPLPVSDEALSGLFVEDLTKNNYITVTVAEGHVTARKIEILVREPRKGDDVGYWRLVHTIDKDDALSYASPHSYSSPNYIYLFTNQRGTEIDISDSLRPYDYIPLKARALAFVERNRLVFGNYVRGYANLIPDVVLSSAYWSLAGSLGAEDLLSVDITQYLDYIDDPTNERLWTAEEYTITLPATIYVGGIYKIVARYGYGPDMEKVYTHVAATGETNIDIATAFAALMHADWPEDYDGSTGSIVITGNSASFWRVQAASPGEFGTPAANIGIFGSVAHAVAGNVLKNTGWKRGASHLLGIVYRDAQGRSGGVVVGPSMQIYLKSPPEQLEAGTFRDENSTAITSPNYSTNINVRINHLPPSWASTYQFVYLRDNLSKAEQYLIKEIKYALTTGASPSVLIDVNGYIDIEALKTVKSLVKSYVFEKGDRIRFIAYPAGGVGARSFTLFSTYYDKTINGVDETTGAILIDNFGFAAAGIINGTIVEIYHPAYEAFTTADNTVVSDYSEQVKSHYFEIGPVMAITGGYHQSAGQTGDQNQDATHYGIVVLSRGDSYTRIRSIAGMSYPCESDSISDYYESAVMHKGRIAVYIPDAAQITYLNGLTYGGLNSNSYDQLNFMFSFNYDGYTNEIPERYGAICKLVCNGDILKTIQQNKVSSIYIGRDAATTIEGSDIIRTTDSVLGSIRPSVDDFGSIFPESVVTDGSSIFFFDIYSKAYIANTPSGNMVISNLGLRNHFTDLCNILLTRDFTLLKAFSAIDQFGGIFLSIVDSTSGSALSETLYLNPNEKKWKSFEKMTPEYLCGGYRLISFLSGALWAHHHPAGVYGLIYGVQVEQSIRLSTATLPGEDKVFLVLAINTSLNKRLTRTYDLTNAYASGTITISGTPVAGETFKVGLKTFTFRAARAIAGEVTISSNNTTQAAYIVYALVMDHDQVNATSTAGVVTIVSIPYGLEGNAIDLEKVATGVAVSGAHLAGGQDTADALVLKKMWGCEYNGDLCIPVSEVNPSGMKTRIKTARFERLDNELVSDIPRDITDPTYATVLERVVNGRKLSGKQLDVTIRNQADSSVTLESVSITYVKEK